MRIINSIRTKLTNTENIKLAKKIIGLSLGVGALTYLISKVLTESTIAAHSNPLNPSPIAKPLKNNSLSYISKHDNSSVLVTNLEQNTSHSLNKLVSLIYPNNRTLLTFPNSTLLPSPLTQKPLIPSKQDKISEIPVIHKGLDQINAPAIDSDPGIDNEKLNTYRNYKEELFFSNRPKEVQDTIDRVHASLKNMKVEKAWLNKGNHGLYNLLNFHDEDVIIQRIEQANPNKKDLYFLDLGAGGFAWVDEVQKFLTGKYEKDERSFHVIGVTGEGELSHEINKHKNVITHKINGFKLENLLESFHEINLHLEDSVELIVCSWTLRHLVDPIGTLDQAYHLLDQGNGFLFGTGFYPFDQKNRLNTFLAAFGIWNFIARGTTENLSDLDQFALFRDSNCTSNVKQLFGYDTNEPILEAYQNIDSRTKKYANLFFKRLYEPWKQYFGAGFYAPSRDVLRKLLGEGDYMVPVKNENLEDRYLFEPLFKEWDAEGTLLKSYLERYQHEPYILNKYSSHRL